MARRGRERLASGIDRRSLLVGGGVGLGLLLAWAAWPRSYIANVSPAEGEHVFNNFIKIGEDGHIVAVIPQVELGQGSFTQLAQILADELGADWRTIAIEAAPVNPAYTNKIVAAEWSEGIATQLLGAPARWAKQRWATSEAFQVTGSSSSLRAFGEPLRHAGAAARTLLCMAAAERWSVDWRACNTVNGFVVRGNDKERFGPLAAEAAGLHLPSDVPYRIGDEDRLRGKSLPRLDLPAKVDGSLNYAADVRLPDMVFAAIRMGPLGDSRFVGLDRKALEKKPDFKLIESERWVAIAASNWWAANEALNAAKPRFETRGTLPSSKAAAASLGAALAKEGNSVFDVGDAATALATGKVMKAEYRADFALHLALEPMTATAILRDDVLEIWLPTQAPNLARKAAAAAIGANEDDVVIHPMMAGGSFGRKYETEIAAQVAVIAKEVGKPVQLGWSRAQDTQSDRFRPAASAIMQARVEADGQVSGWRADVAAPSTMSEMIARIMDGKNAAAAAHEDGGKLDAQTLSGAIPPYVIPNLSIHHHPVNLGVPTGKWRSGADSFMAFFNECFIDELARESGVEAYSFRMAMLGDNKRLANCLSRVAAIASWSGGGNGTSQGLACHSMQGSHIAVIAQARMVAGSGIAVEKLFAVADVGRKLNPDIAHQQIEGGLLFGMAAAIGNSMTIDNGMVSPTRFGGHRLPTFAQTPLMQIELIGSDAPYGGLGEIAVPAVAPAIANAIFAGSGRRIRTLPLGT